MTAEQITAVFWDFGGVITSSPFDNFNALEQRLSIPNDFIRSVNAHNKFDNAWAHYERNDINDEQFDERFAQESEAMGHRVNGKLVIEAITQTRIRPQMLIALQRIQEKGYQQACLTNNVKAMVSDRADISTAEQQGLSNMAMAMDYFDFVQESSVIGIRKPEPEFYEQALKTAQIKAENVCYLDDLGINLKPAKAMGMTTIKVIDANQALAELSAVLGIDLR